MDSDTEGQIVPERVVDMMKEMTSTMNELAPENKNESSPGPAPAKESSDLPTSSRNAWIQRDTIKQGFFLSTVLRFMFITIPFLVWKIMFFPGLQSGYIDLLLVGICSSIAIAKAARPNA